MSADLTGQKFGRLVVLTRSGIKKRGGTTTVLWLCRCDCGKEKIVAGVDLRKGSTKSCGCLRDEVRKQPKTHGKAGSPEHRSWANMLQRCFNPKREKYRHYGGRNISVCERWLKFENFLEDMGERPGPEYSLDRIDVDGDYSPDNCKWSTPEEQMSNTHRTRKVEYQGEEYTIAQLARVTGVKPRTLYWRIDHGWTIEKAATLRGGKVEAT